MYISLTLCLAEHVPEILPAPIEFHRLYKLLVFLVSPSSFEVIIVA